MSRRKILLLGGGLSLLAIGLGFYVPRPAPDAEAILTFLVPRDEPMSDEAAKSDRPAKIDLQIRIVGLPIFSDDAKQGKRVVGVVTNSLHLFESLQESRRGHITQFAPLTAVSGQPFLAGGVMLRPKVAEDGVSTVLKEYGVRAKGTATLRKDGRLHLQIDVTDSWWSNDRLPDEVVRASASFVLEDQQTGYIGGLKRKKIESSDYHVPLLSELPGIGSWFIFPREVKYDEELLFLVTPKLVSRQ